MEQQLSIVILAYNEQKRLPPTLDSLLSWAEEIEIFDFEVIVVDDGSEDGSCTIVCGYADRFPQVRLVEEHHVGAMHAVLSGFRHARFALVDNMDADCAVHPRKLEKLVEFVEDRSIAQSSRVLSGGLPDVEGKSLVRRVMSAVMSRLFITLFRCGVHDRQIGYRLYTENAVLRITPLMRPRHDGLKIAEIIVRGYGLGMDIHEIPLPYIHDDDLRTVPKSPIKGAMVPLRAVFTVFQVWAQCGIDYLRGLLARNPIRGGFILVPVSPFRCKFKSVDGA